MDIARDNLIMDEFSDLRLEIDEEDIFDLEGESVLFAELDIDKLENLHKLTILYCRWYQFQTWKNWTKEIDNAVLDFYRDYRQYPNIVLVSKATYARLLLYISTSKSILASGAHSDCNYLTLVEILESKNCSLEFCIDESIGSYEFLLILDMDPTWMGSEIPIEEGLLYRNIMEI